MTDMIAAAETVGMIAAKTGMILPEDVTDKVIILKAKIRLPIPASRRIPKERAGARLA